MKDRNLLSVIRCFPLNLKLNEHVFRKFFAEQDNTLQLPLLNPVRGLPVSSHSEIFLCGFVCGISQMHLLKNFVGASVLSLPGCLV